MKEICPCCGTLIELEYSCDICGSFICENCKDYDHDGTNNIIYCTDCGSNGELEEYLAQRFQEDCEDIE